MDRGNRLLRAVCTALTAALMAGCSAIMIARALGLAAPWAGVYLLALIAAAATQLFRRGTAWAVGAAALLAVGMGALLAAYLPAIRRLLEILSQPTVVDGREVAREGLEAAQAAAGRSVGCIGAFLLGALLGGLLCAPAGAPFALLVLLASVIFALAAREEISIWTALPGLAAGVAAFGLPSDARRDGVPPGLLIPALALTALALALTPGERVTWGPLEDLAERVRSVVEDYIRFTEQRMAFSIGDKGYDRAGMIDDSVVSMLGGPANPTKDSVMRVETDTDLLLRGSIKRSYTGYSWVDDQTKARYLYYDFTHRRVRERVFDIETTADSDAFAEHSAKVELLEGGTSTLFVPAQLSSFRMGLSDAVYYNSTGELFLTRDVQAGDRYEFVARLPVSEEALIRETEARAGLDDPEFAEARESYGDLPPYIDTRVFSMAVELVQDSYNAAEKAFAIQNYLAQNYRYTLNGGHPEGNADFVSWFLLDSKEGYCSYFASAMTVLCRIAGLPARYVEGYAVEAQPGGETIVTGENAHAWVEVYLNGIGWMPFDPTAAARALQGDGPSGADGSGSSPNENSDIMDDPEALNPPDEGGEETPEPSPSPSLAPGETPTPSPDDGELPPQDDGELPPPPENSAGEDAESDADDPGGANLAWLWWLLILLALAALALLAVRRIRRRLRETDPLLLTAKAGDMDHAALLLFRATLTLLSQLGYAPQSGETPEAFAERAAEALNNPEYLRFAQGVAHCRYAGEEASAAVVRSGRKAYLTFLHRLSRVERLRFHVRRVLHGLGDLEVIP